MKTKLALSLVLSLALSSTAALAAQESRGLPAPLHKELNCGPMMQDGEMRLGVSAPNVWASADGEKLYLEHRVIAPGAKATFIPLKFIRTLANENGTSTDVYTNKISGHGLNVIRRGDEVLSGVVSLGDATSECKPADDQE